MIRRIIAAFILATIFICCFGVLSVSAESSTNPPCFYVNVEIKGTGGVTTSQWAITSGDIVTLEANESDHPFVFWNLDGNFELIEGLQTDTVLTIRPLSDILATATFDDGLEEHAIPATVAETDNTSPQTSTDTTSVYIVLLIFAVAALIAILCGSKIYKNNKKK